MPPLPAFRTFAEATKLTTVALGLSAQAASDRLLDGLCDGAIYADGLFRSEAGPPNRLTIAPANWQMLKYNDTPLHYDWVEFRTGDLLAWLGLLPRSEVASEDRGMRTGAPGRPTSMHLVIGEANRRAANDQILETTKRAFAETLATWIAKQPGVPPVTPKTICNNAEVGAIFNGSRKAQKPLLK